MKKTTIKTEKNRNQEAYEEDGMVIPIGPPERVVDVLGLPEPVATELHNALHKRGLLTFADVSRNPKSVQGALQEVLMLDVQKLTEAYYKYEHQEAHDGR